MSRGRRGLQVAQDGIDPGHNVGQEGRPIGKTSAARATARALFAVLVLGACAGSSDERGLRTRDSAARRAPAEGEREKGGTRTGTHAGRGPDGAGDDRRGSHDGEPAVVGRVIDGDTIEVTSQRKTLDIRLIGVDTPETVHPTVGVECLGKAASAFTRFMLEGRRVRLEFDVERRDHYGRTLAYVWIGRDMFNELLVERGYAQVSTYPPNVRYVDRFMRAQREARRADRGLWSGRCDLSPGDEHTPGRGRSQENRSGACDPNYAGACIPPYSQRGDLDCTDIGATGFRSTGSDPHGFDGDRDGVACET